MGECVTMARATQTGLRGSNTERTVIVPGTVHDAAEEFHRLAAEYWACGEFDRRTGRGQLTYNGTSHTIYIYAEGYQP